MDTQANRSRFPEVAQLVDRLRANFGKVHVSSVRDLDTGEVIGVYPPEDRLPHGDQAAVEALYAQISDCLGMLEIEAVGRRVRALRAEVADIEARTQNGMRIVEVFPLRAKAYSKDPKGCWWGRAEVANESHQVAYSQYSNTGCLSHG